MRFMIGSGRVRSMRIAVIAGLACTVVAGCTAGSSGSTTGSAESPGTSMTSSGPPVVAVGCPLNAAAVSAALKTPVVDASTTYFRLPQPALCAFQTSSQPGLTVQITSFPFTTGRDKNRSLASIQHEVRSAVDVSRSTGLTYRITQHPEWGTDAFTLLEYNSGRAAAIEVWTTKYSAAIDDEAGKVTESAYLADATNLGDALVEASK